jgi:hypothetical protein
LPAYGVEKRGPRSQVRDPERFDLSDRSGIDDRDLGKGRSAPEKVPIAVYIEFFNGMGQARSLMRDRFRPREEHLGPA